MIKILKHGENKKKKIKKFTCNRCGCKYATNEYEYSYDICGRTTIHIKCPECDRKSIIVR